MSQTVDNEPAVQVGADPLLSVSGLTVGFASLGRMIPAIEDVSFKVARGEVLTVVGESGSGKSVTAMAVLGLLPRNARVTGSITFDGVEVTRMTAARRRSMRAKDVSVVFQNPLAALNPVYTIGFQLVEAIRLSDPSTGSSAARARAVELLEAVGIPEPTARMRFYPHQLSGGQCQRVMIAMALSSRPRLLIADEPTTALDVTVQADVLALLRDITRRTGTSVLLITHDMGVVADIADRVVVMRDGSVVEQAPVQQLFDDPREDYTRALLDAVPRIRDHRKTAAEPTAETPIASPVLAVSGLVVEYPGRDGREPFRAVDGIDLSIAPGEMLGLVGESGSGKSTVSRCAVGLVRPRSGTVEVLGQSVVGATASGLQAVRSRIGMVFQNPADSLDPRIRVGDSVAEPIRVHRPLSEKALRVRVGELFEQVGLNPGVVGRYPRELSGGQLQRVAIARALALSPDLLIADEPTSSLDVSVQAKLLKMLTELHRELGFACLFVSHDLAVVDQLCTRVAVMRRGVVVEAGPPAQVLGAPRDPYARRLLNASLVPDPAIQRTRRLTADARPGDAPPGEPGQEHGAP